MITKEVDNFLRTIYLHYQVVTPALRRYFEGKHPNLVSDLSCYYSRLHNMYNRKILYQAQWDILHPPTGSNAVSTADFDVTLMVCLLRSLPPVVSTPTTGFDALPLTSDTSDGAHIARIKYYKNIIVSYSKDGILSDTFFKTIWSDLEKAIHGLGNQQDVKDAADAKSKVLDYESVKKLINQHDFFYQKFEDHDTKITKLETDYIQQNRKRLNDHAKHEYKQCVHSIKMSKLDTTVEKMETGDVR
ncbi:unnamed protein product [Mytilus coruscus]|uniref:DZIP3-like HEPN domain-containing protein n=1 Tax=Mytilus coruscus TaxID=42192 RepID=A0A6J8CV19_MYTCO|nr:unnamed protein product [Mytilus coruscus]